MACTCYPSGCLGHNDDENVVAIGISSVGRKKRFTSPNINSVPGEIVGGNTKGESEDISHKRLSQRRQSRSQVAHKLRRWDGWKAKRTRRVTRRRPCFDETELRSSLEPSRTSGRSGRGKAAADPESSVVCFVRAFVSSCAWLCCERFDVSAFMVDNTHLPLSFRFHVESTRPLPPAPASPRPHTPQTQNSSRRPSFLR